MRRTSYYHIKWLWNESGKTLVKAVGILYGLYTWRKSPALGWVKLADFYKLSTQTSIDFFTPLNTQNNSVTSDFYTLYTPLLNKTMKLNN